MRTFRLDRGQPLFDIRSYGRAGPGERLTLAQVEMIQRTVGRAPEVMVKVSGGRGASSSRGVAAHFGYIGRDGDLEIEN
jgi:hypothetical protein